MKLRTREPLSICRRFFKTPADTQKSAQHSRSSRNRHPKSKPSRIGNVLPVRGLTFPPDYGGGIPVIWRIRTSSARIAVLDPQLRPTAPPDSRPRPDQDRQARRIALINEHSKAPPARGTGGALQAAGYRSESPVTPTRWCPGACSCSRAPLG